MADVPAPAGDGVRVRVRSSGICGSDLHMVSSDVFRPPGILGHEFAGITEDGTPVAIEPMRPCGECESCRTGAYQHCRLGPAMLLGTSLDGGMADEVVVPARCLVPLPSGLAVEDACLVEPTAVAVHGFLRVGLHGGHRVAVVGGGSIGLAAVAVARASGACVDLVARHDAQRAAGERLGARALGESDPDAGGYDIVVDAAGTASALERCVGLARSQGTLLLLATYWEGLDLPGFALCMKEVSVVPSAMYGRRALARDVDVAAAVLANDAEIARTMITHRFPLDAAVEAFETASARSSGAIKVVLEP